MVDPTKALTAEDAKTLARDLQKTLRSRNVWCMVTEIHEPDLKFIKIEASIKVRQENV